MAGHLEREWFSVPTGAQRITRRSRLVEGHALAFTRVPWFSYNLIVDLPKKKTFKTDSYIIICAILYMFLYI